MRENTEDTTDSHPTTTDRPGDPDSDRLREALERLREAEERRIAAPYSSPEFFARAHDVEVQAREVFRLADANDGVDDGWGDEDDGDETRN
jgi:hypothetical protein